MKWLIAAAGAILVSIAIYAVAVTVYTPAPKANDGIPEEVRVQDYNQDGFHCKVFTHDKGTNADPSIAVWCNP